MSGAAATYEASGLRFEGALIGAGGAGRATVLMAPDWMGVGEAALAMARTIAGWGFTVVVADMYGAGRRPASVDEAIALAAPLKSDQAEVRTRIAAAHEAARAQTGGACKAAIGFCFGGMNVLELARSGADLALTVSIHGDLLTRNPAAAGDIGGEILVLHGAADPVSPKPQRDAFEAEMEAAGATWTMAIFGKAVHSFTDPGAAMPGVAQFDAYANAWTLHMLKHALLDTLR